MVLLPGGLAQGPPLLYKVKFSALKVLLSLESDPT
jgi:hypothetical protein